MITRIAWYLDHDEAWTLVNEIRTEEMIQHWAERNPATIFFFVTISTDVS